MKTNKNQFSHTISTLLLVTLCFYLPLLLWGFLSDTINLLVLVFLSIMAIVGFMIAVLILPNSRQNKFIQILIVFLLIEICLSTVLVLGNIFSDMKRFNVGTIFAVFSIIGFASAFGLFLKDKRVTRQVIAGLIIGIFPLASAILQSAISEGIYSRSHLMVLNYFSSGFFTLGTGLINLILLSFQDLTSIKYKSLFENNTLSKAQNEAVLRVLGAGCWLFIAWYNFAAAINNL